MAADNEAHVFVPSDDHIWLPVTVEGVEGNEVVYTLDTDTAKELELDGRSTHRLDLDAVPTLPKERGLFMGKLPLQNPTNDPCGVEDMANLAYLNAPSILFNLRTRFRQGLPYTQTADIVLAVNPYRWLDHLYTEEAQSEYLVYAQGNMTPHIYRTSAGCYNSMKEDGTHQSILVSGESGAGKTETVKLLLKHLAFMAGGAEKPEMVHGIGQSWGTVV